MTVSLRSSVAAFVAVCLALSGLAPSVSRVLAASLATVHDLCLAEGAAPDPATSGGQRPAVHDAACALCLAHGGSAAASPPAAPGFLPAFASTGPIDAEHAAVPARGRWLAPGPRGPPADPPGIA